MPINTKIHNTGGPYRFIDYVSLLPEFLREEKDVVTLLQIFSDYLNNAYRNIKISKNFEFKLVATEGMVGYRKTELMKLRNLFLECERKNLPILYLSKPKRFTNIVVDYDGDDIIPNKTIIPGYNGLNDGDRFFINYIKYPERCGLYYYDLNTDSLIKDPDDFSQDVFSLTPDKPQLSPVGYVPRMIQFYPSNISDIKYRKVKKNSLGNIYYEIYFTSNILDISDLPSVNSFNINNNKYLVDYYDFLGNVYPDDYNYGKFSLYFLVNTCNPWDLNKSIFYAKDLTLYDTRQSVTNFDGENIYIDPSFKYKRDLTSNVILPDNKQLFYNKEVETDKKLLKIEFQQSNGVLLENDYVNRISFEKYDEFEFNNINIIENIIVLNEETNLKSGDWVLLKLVSGILPSGLNDFSLYKIEKVFSDKKSIKLFGVDIINLTVGVGGIYKIKLHFNDVGIINNVENNKVIYKTYSGDIISDGNFVVIRGNKPVVWFKQENNIRPWEYSYGNIYYVGDKVVFNGIKYDVIKTVDVFNTHITPDNNFEYYKVSMDDITINKKEIVYNPYMFGAYNVKRIKYNENIDFEKNTFNTLYNTLFVTPTENNEIKFKYPQREWIFNPKIANELELSRNGWMVCYMSPNNYGNYDIANPNSTQILRESNSATIQKNVLTLTFVEEHLYTENDYVNIDASLTPYESISGIYPIKNVPNKYTIVVDTFFDVGDTLQNILGVIKVKLVNKIQNGAVIFSRKNLFVPTKYNPEICPENCYYKYDLNEIEWCKYSKRIVANVSPLVDVGNINKFYGEYSVPLISNSSLKHTFKDGDVIYLVNQDDTSENGYYRVRKNSKWSRLDDKITLKIRNICVDAQMVFDDVEYGEKIFYNRYEFDEVINYVQTNKNSFILEKSHVGDVYFIMPVIENIDTTKSYHKIYDAKYDSNSIVVSNNFLGVPDMKYPIAEKIERLAYNKDPNVIDYDLIAYLARFMGYDITIISDDIAQSDLYKSDDERKMALRKFIQYLPEFNALKSTKNGLEMLMLMFGIVGKVITLWTENDDPYNQLIPSDDIDMWRYDKMKEGLVSNLIPTPHFMVKLEIDGHFPIDLDLENISRLKLSIINYKPINTVFDGIMSYLKINSSIKMEISPFDAQGLFRADVGYNIDFKEITKNCLI